MAVSDSTLPARIPASFLIRLIEYSFGDRTARVEFTDTPAGVKVMISFDGESTHSIEQQQSGWQAILENFARHAERTSR